MDVCALSAIELRAALRRGDLSATDALEAVLDRADEIAETVNPFTARLDAAARQAAKAADEALARGEGGLLCGVPVTTKDSHWMSGVESTSGSRARRGFVPTETTASIERLQAAGAVSMQVLGRRCADDRVLAAAQAIESVLGFDAHPPDQGGRT